MLTTDTLTYKALAAVKAQCDHAHSDDGLGFSGYDADFAHDLIDKGSRWGWSEKQYACAKRLAHKYRKQITKLGFDPNEIADENAVIERAERPVATRSVEVWFDCTTKGLARAVIFARDGRTFCIPRSLIRNMSAQFEYGIMIELPEWFVSREGLRQYQQAPEQYTREMAA